VRPPRQTADLPPGFPQEYQRLVTLRDGRSVLIRPVLPSDAPALAESIASADADTTAADTATTASADSMAVRSQNEDSA